MRKKVPMSSHSMRALGTDELIYGSIEKYGIQCIEDVG